MDKFTISLLQPDIELIIALDQRTIAILHCCAGGHALLQINAQINVIVELNGTIALLQINVELIIVGTIAVMHYCTIAVR